MKKILIAFSLIVLCSCRMTGDNYGVYLSDGNLHLLTTSTINEARKYITEHEESHGRLTIKKINNP